MSHKILELPKTSDMRQFITDMLEDADKIKDLVVYVESKKGDSYVLTTGVSPYQMALACKLLDRHFNELVERG